MTTPLIIIPCRAGSKGIPNKNFKDFCGKPLWKWTLDTAKELGWPFVITTDNEGCARCNESGFDELFEPWMIRESDLHGDSTPMVDLVAEVFADEFRFDDVVLLQPTSPKRDVMEIREAMTSLQHFDYTSVVSVVSVPRTATPDYVGHLHGPCWLRFPPTIRRQDARPAYERDGSFYLTTRKTVEGGDLYGSRCVGIVHARALPHLDTQEQWVQAEKEFRP